MDTQFEGVFINDHRNPRKSTTIFAQNGQLTLSDGSPAFILQNGIQFEHDLNQNVITSIKFDKYNLVFDYNQAIKRIKNTEHQELSIQQLITTPKSEKNFNELRAEGVKRILWPFLSIFAPLILLTILLNTRFSRKTLYLYPIAGTTLGFLLILCNSYAASLARFNWTVTFYIIGLDILITAIAVFFVMERSKGNFRLHS